MTNDQEDQYAKRRKKYATDLSLRTGHSADEIEAGVSKLIDESNVAIGSERLTPPHGSPIWYKRFLELNSRQKITVADLEFIRLNIAGSKSEYKIFGGLRFLQLIDERGRATQKLASLHVVGDEFKKKLADIIQLAYKEFLSKVIVKSGRRDSVINYFMQRYDLGRRTAEQSLNVFVWLADQAGIELSPELTKGTPLEEFKTDSRRTLPRKANHKSAKKTESQEKASLPEGMIELKLGSVTVVMPKGDRGAATQAKKLIDLYLEGIQ